MTKLPKNHPAIYDSVKKFQSKPSPKVEQALAEVREKTRELKKSMAIQLKKVFDK